VTAPGSPYLRPDWDYRIWEFNANHRQLLLRCDYAADGVELDRSEVWFGNVSFLVLAPIIRGLHLRRPNESELARLQAAHGQEKIDWAYVWLINEAGTHFVSSGRPSWREGRRPIEAPSFFAGHPWPERPEDTTGSI
jgi:hypothetical protein